MFGFPFLAIFANRLSSILFARSSLDFDPSCDILNLADVAISIPLPVMHFKVLIVLNRPLVMVVSALISIHYNSHYRSHTSFIHPYLAP